MQDSFNSTVFVSSLGLVPRHSGLLAVTIDRAPLDPSTVATLHFLAEPPSLL